MIKKLTISDLDEAMLCIEDARKLLADSGSLQWNTPDGYPRREDILKDIEAGVLYGYVDDSGIRGICAIIFGREGNYDIVYDGNWRSSAATYLAIHRIAVRANARGTGVSVSLVDFAKKLMADYNTDTIKADTHEMNIPMQKLLLKCGFKCIGKIKLLRTNIDNERLAFDYINN